MKLITKGVIVSQKIMPGELVGLKDIVFEKQVTTLELTCFHTDYM